LSPEKLDLRKKLAHLYHPPVGDVQILKIPRMKYIMVDGGGSPESDDFHQAIGTIYNVAYTMKFRSKKLLKKDYNVMALEGLWWMEGGGFDVNKRGSWQWTLMVVLPDFVTPKLFADSVKEVKAKKNPPGVEKAHLAAFAEGLCAQTMHVGPYSTESQTIARLEAFVREHGYRMVGKHHEIYLGDPRRAAPSKLRTIIRHPIAKA
jgi:hypothetical protein